ncbi:MAG: hypothetical protein AAGI68_13665 [Planctomycetota bacterium]
MSSGPDLSGSQSEFGARLRRVWWWTRWGWVVVRSGVWGLGLAGVVLMALGCGWDWLRGLGVQAVVVGVAWWLGMVVWWVWRSRGVEGALRCAVWWEGAQRGGGLGLGLELSGNMCEGSGGLRRFAVERLLEDWAGLRGRAWVGGGVRRGWRSGGWLACGLWGLGVLVFVMGVVSGSMAGEADGGAADELAVADGDGLAGLEVVWREPSAGAGASAVVVEEGSRLEVAGRVLGLGGGNGGTVAVRLRAAVAGVDGRPGGALSGAAWTVRVWEGDQGDQRLSPAGVLAVGGEQGVGLGAEAGDRLGLRWEVVGGEGVVASSAWLRLEVVSGSVATALRGWAEEASALRGGLRRALMLDGNAGGVEPGGLMAGWERMSSAERLEWAERLRRFVDSTEGLLGLVDGRGGPVLGVLMGAGQAGRQGLAWMDQSEGNGDLGMDLSRFEAWLAEGDEPSLELKVVAAGSEQSGGGASSGASGAGGGEGQGADGRVGGGGGVGEDRLAGAARLGVLVRRAAEEARGGADAADDRWSAVPGVYRRVAQRYVELRAEVER